MAANARQVEVNATSPTFLAKGRGVGKGLAGVIVLEVPANESTVYVGGPDVTAATGFPLDPSATVPARLELSGQHTGDSWYGITASGVETVMVATNDEEA